LIRQARAAYRDGFTGKLAIHPAQVDALNAVFAPSADAIAAAQRVVAAFAESNGAGVVSLDGRMLDRPDLARARRTLALAGDRGA
jgi:citrate lyase subunit beta/citryl-CoA lyase